MWISGHKHNDPGLLQSFYSRNETNAFPWNYLDIDKWFSNLDKGFSKEGSLKQLNVKLASSSNSKSEYFDYFCRGISLVMLDSIMKCTFGTTAYGLYMILSMAYSLKNSTSNLLTTYFHWENFQIFCERIDFWQPASSHLTPLQCTGPVHWLGNGVQANAAVARLIVRATFTWKCVKNC